MPNLTPFIMKAVALYAHLAAPVHRDSCLPLHVSGTDVLRFSQVSGILVCEAGCVLETLDTFVANKG